MTKTSNISYDQSWARGKGSERHSPKKVFDVEKVRIISSTLICNGWLGRFLFERPWTDLTNKGGAVWTLLDSKP
jgi:hypothetical protein